jgi:hypothetical protein
MRLRHRIGRWLLRDEHLHNWSDWTLPFEAEVNLSYGLSDTFYGLTADTKAFTRQVLVQSRRCLQCGYYESRKVTL